MAKFKIMDAICFQFVTKSTCILSQINHPNSRQLKYSIIIRFFYIKYVIVTYIRDEILIIIQSAINVN